MNKQEAYAAELFAMRGIQHLASRLYSGRDFTMLTESHAAIERVQWDAPGPRHDETIGLAKGLCEQANTLTVKWVPAHRGIAGNEVADSYTRDAAE